MAKAPTLQPFGKGFTVNSLLNIYASYFVVHALTKG